MLTRDAVRVQLDAIADEILQTPGIYHELFAREYSARVHNWINHASREDAELIARIAENDPDYLGDIESEIEMPDPVVFSNREPLFNPNWDVSY